VHGGGEFRTARPEYDTGVVQILGSNRRLVARILSEDAPQPNYPAILGLDPWVEKPRVRPNTSPRLEERILRAERPLQVLVSDERLLARGDGWVVVIAGERVRSGYGELARDGARGRGARSGRICTPNPAEAPKSRREDVKQFT
jgi:hypothetical protein